MDRNDCVLEIRAFVRFGDYALNDLLPKVIGNIWNHYGINDEAEKEAILVEAGVLRPSGCRD